MTRPPVLRLTATVALVGLLALSGCSKDDGGSPSGTGTDAPKSPMSKYWDAMYSNGADDNDWEKKQLEAEQIVAQCMEESGFEYTPVDYSSMGGSISFSDSDFEDQNTEEWVAKYGYGFQGMEEEPDPDAEPTEEPEFNDPNSDYVQSLSETAQQAYYTTLYGEQTMEFDEDGEEVWEYDWTQAGCQGLGQNEIFGNGGGSAELEDEFKDLIEAMNSLWQDAESDPKIAKITSEWASCIADAGFTFATPGDASNAASDLTNKMYEDSQPTNDEDWENWTGPSAADRAEAKDEEIKIALADFRCKKQVDWDKVNQDVQFAIEAQFVKDHEAELDAYVKAYQAANK